MKKLFKEKNYQIVHSNINTLSVFPLYAAKKAKVPIRIAHSHSTSNKKEVKRNIIKNVLRPFSKLYANKYICCSELSGRWLFGNKEYEKGKVFLLNNAIEIDKFNYDEKIRVEKREKIKIKEETLVIGNVGRMVETKNQSFLLTILTNISKQIDAVLVLIGQGPLEAELKKKVEEMRIEDKVIFLGQVEDVNNWYQAFDIFILPSFYEGFGMALLEAQASNLPCITATSVPKEVKLIDEFEFISLNASIDAWTGAVIKYKDANNRKSNKKILTDKGFDVSVEVNKLSNYYKEIIEGE